MVEVPKWNGLTGGQSPPPQHQTPGKISNDSAQAIHDVLSDLDAEMDKCVSEVFFCVHSIATAQTRIDELYRKRSTIAGDLAMQASPDFTPTPKQRDMAMTAAPPMPASSPMYGRFYRQHPLKR